MNPDNNNPQSINPNLEKLEQDLSKLTQEAASTTQPTPSQEPPVPLQQTQPPVTPIEPIAAPVQPIETPPAPPNVPVENIKKGTPLMTVAMALLIIAVVVAVGFVAYTKFTTPKTPAVVVPVQTPTAVPIPEATPQASTSATPDITANWKMYTNSEIGFSIKYPQEWLIQNASTPRIVSFDTKSGTPGEFFVSYHKNINDLSKWLSDNQAGEIISTIKINDNQFSVIKGGSLYVSREYAIKVGINDYLRIAIEPYPNKVISDEMINQILSTFKFTDSTPSASPQ